MTWLPTTKRLRAGRYVMSCGEESVAIYRASGGYWLAQPVAWGRYDRRETFMTKQQAAEWAFDWLVEYA